MTNALSIRICTEADLAPLARWFSSEDPRLHIFRHARQQDGRSVYLIAWRDGVPVGHLDLWWQPAEDCPPAQQHLGGCPELNSLAVLPAYRSQGIGTQLIVAAEQLARERGFREVCVGVEPENTRARSLYQRLGYRDWGHGVVEACWLLPNGDGRRHAEEAVYLRKSLGPD